jgi:dihydrofolate synthase / folylpolyglutamate synthase
LLERLYRLEQFGIKLGLANIRALCDALGHPERAFASLHVAGTNGKGSVAAMAHAALRASGIHAARYTSPHLVELNERFMIGDAFVGSAELEAAAARVLDCADALVGNGTLAAPPTFFEATTAIGFELFRGAEVDMAIIEVGLGGRFDATNVVQPMATAITSIGLDHQQHLGGTLAQIAFEKAGIIKTGVPVVVGTLPGEASGVVRAAAAERSARVVHAVEQSTVTPLADEERQTIEVRTQHHRYGPLTLALRGEHQVHNALVAIALLEEARAAGVQVTFEGIERGLAHTSWPARLEVLVFPGGRQVLLDAAHNPDGAISLARFLARYRPERPPLVFAAMRDKDVAAILRPLLPVAGPVIVTAAPSTRTSSPEELAAAVRAIDPSHAVMVEPDPIRAVDLAWAHAPRVCVAGSIFLAGAVRGALKRHAIVDISP